MDKRKKRKKETVEFGNNNKTNYLETAYFYSTELKEIHIYIEYLQQNGNKINI